MLARRIGESAFAVLAGWSGSLKTMSFLVVKVGRRSRGP
ncbi:hypothetical protein JOF41_003513 [Saccharothrix coeruleofusca]|nr:hypothetical protein [Saccharothrix coeruleofusca]